MLQMFNLRFYGFLVSNIDPAFLINIRTAHFWHRFKDWIIERFKNHVQLYYESQDTTTVLGCVHAFGLPE